MCVCVIEWHRLLKLREYARISVKHTHTWGQSMPPGEIGPQREKAQLFFSLLLLTGHTHYFVRVHDRHYSSINLMPLYLLVPDSELKQHLHCIEEHKNKTELQNFNRTRVWNRSYIHFLRRARFIICPFVDKKTKQIDDTDWRPLPVVKKYDTLSL